MNRLLLANATGWSPNSSGFRDSIMSSYRYGLTEGNYNSEEISLTELGRSLTAPRNEVEAIEARRRSMRNVPIFEQLLNHFANSKLPEPQFLKNTIERAPFNIDPSWSAEVATLFTSTARDVGYLQEIRGSNYIITTGGATQPAEEPAEQGGEGTTEEAVPVDLASLFAGGGVERRPDADATPSPKRTSAPPVQMFVAHGKRHEPLDQLQKILNEWRVPFIVAVQEPNAGRPISQKVADVMQACSAGIFIFTADEEFKDESGQTVYRPSQNVIYELGAASLLYGRKVVIFKERGVSFPSDFSDLGWIEFDRDHLDATAMQLLRELIQLGAIRMVSAAD